MNFLDHIRQVDRTVQDRLGGITFTYQPQHEDPVEGIPGMFDERYVLVDPSVGGGVGQVTPALWVRLEDLPVHPEDDDPTITIGERSYTVTAREPDGYGSIRLLLNRVT